MRFRKLLVLVMSISLILSTIIFTFNADASSPMPMISFETTENLSYITTYNGATKTYVTSDVTHGTRAMKVNVGTLDATYGGVNFDDTGAWNWGSNPTFSVDAKNTNSTAMQFRIDITDTSNRTRTYYFAFNAGQARTIAINNFGPLTASYSGSDGWWGAESGIDCSNINSFKMYLWEEKPGSTANTFVVDKVNVVASNFSKISFESGLPSNTTTSNATTQIVTQGVTDGTKALKVDYQVASYPSVTFSTQTPWNWGAGNCLFFDVTNQNNTSKTIHISVKDNANKETVSRITIPANSTKTVYMSFNDKVLNLGMRFFPPTAEGLCCGYAWGDKTLDLNNIVSFSFWVFDNTVAFPLIYDNIRVSTDPAASPTYLNGAIDQFGQFTGKTWTGKITSAADLVASKNAELQALNAGNPALPVATQYGGWSAGPTLQATGHFRTQKYNGKWSLVDPLGKLFFATGVDIVRLPDSQTWITGRENLFNGLPDKNGTLGSHYTYVTNYSSGKTPYNLTEGWLFNFYTSNLQQKYGTDYKNQWRDMSVKRFKNWGFSTLGNWCEPELFYGKGSQHKMAYVANFWINHGVATIDDGNSYWHDIADPFDPAFRTVARSEVDSLVAAGVHNDPWCVGVYVDNEISWGNSVGNNDSDKYIIIFSVFKQNASATTSYAKREFISKLKAKYNNNIGSLSSAWGISVPSWATLEASYQLPAQFTTGIRNDVSMLLTTIAEKYYSVVNEEIKRSMPNMLYLGSRFAEWGVTLEVEQACARYSDVVSYNAYKESVDAQAWIHDEVIDKPCIIGEFHFGSADERMYSPGLIVSNDQEARGTMYKNYIRELLANPYFVGAHWFQYMDQPCTGRAWDGENYNAGFVDIADVPYDKLVNAAKDIHSQVFSIRYGSISTTEKLKISFETSENSAIISTYGQATTQYVTQGVTEGARALKVNVGTLDYNYSGATFNDQSTWNWGNNPVFTADITNSGSQEIQLRSDIVDSSGATRTYYFAIPANTTRTITIDNLGPASANYSGSDGWWGAESGLDKSNIDAFNMYLWEDKPNTTVNTFTVDNIKVVSN